MTMINLAAIIAIAASIIMPPVVLVYEKRTVRSLSLTGLTTLPFVYVGLILSMGNSILFLNLPILVWMVLCLFTRRARQTRPSVALQPYLVAYSATLIIAGLAELSGGRGIVWLLAEVIERPTVQGVWLWEQADIEARINCGIVFGLGLVMQIVFSAMGSSERILRAMAKMKKIKTGKCSTLKLA